MKEELFIEFAGLRDKGVHEYGRIVLKNGKLRVEGDKLLKRLLKNKVRDIRPKGSGRWVEPKKNPELFLRILPYYYSGTRLCAGKINEERRRGASNYE